MTYTVLALAAVLVALLDDLVLMRTALITTARFWIVYLVLLGFQLVVNGLLTGLPVVRYDPHTIAGVRIAHAPIEDVAFGFALILMTLAGWVRLTGRTPRMERL